MNNVSPGLLRAEKELRAILQKFLNLELGNAKAVTQTEGNMDRAVFDIPYF